MATPTQLQRCVLFMVACLLVGTVATAQGQDTMRTRPALVGTGDNSLAALLKYPSGALKRGESAMVQFQAKIREDGKPEDVVIQRAPMEGQAYIRAVENALRDARFEPAMLDGRRVAVTVPVTVLFMAAREQPVIAIYLNHSDADIQAKNNYIARQELLERPYDPGFPVDARPMKREGMVEVSYCLGTDGKMQDVKVVQESPPGYGLASAVMEGLRKARYIPAFRDGKAVRECGEFVSQFEGST